MSRIKLIALDLDGTLLDDEKRVTVETRKTIKRAVDSGITVMFSTGRGVQTAESIWQELELESPIVLLNGAEIWEAPGRLRNRTFLSRESIRFLHEMTLSYGAGYWGYSVESLTGGSDWTVEMFERDWMKFGIKHDSLEIVQEIRQRLVRLGTMQITGSSPLNVEISPKGITKESGVREICEMLGIEMSEVMAVGDSDNDVTLLKAAGISVAMGNAEEHVKAIADVITSSNNEDGVARAIEQYVFC